MSTRCTSPSVHDCGKHKPKWMIVYGIVLISTKMQKWEKKKINLNLDFAWSDCLDTCTRTNTYPIERVDIELPTWLMSGPTHFVLYRKWWGDIRQIFQMIFGQTFRQHHLHWIVDAFTFFSRSQPIVVAPHKTGTHLTRCIHHCVWLFESKNGYKKKKKRIQKTCSLQLIKMWKKKMNWKLIIRGN